MLELTWYVSVTILKGMEVVHEFFYGDLKSLKQASVLKEPIWYLKDKIYIYIYQTPWTSPDPDILNITKVFNKCVKLKNVMKKIKRQCYK